MPSPSVPPRLRRKLLSAVTVVSLAAAGLAASSTSTMAAPSPVKPASAVKATHTVTLITGDRVTVTTLADGKQTVDVTRPANATGGVQFREAGGDLLVLPDEAMGLLAADKLDRRLFNVTDLIEMGYDDARSDGVPLIATFAPAKTRGLAPSAPQGSKKVRDLASIGGAALKADKKQTRTFWSSVAPAGSLTLGAGVTKLWLDGKVKVNLKESVPMIGAPDAWAAGFNGAGVKVAVLDTGIDVAHPDLAGQIDEMVSFVPTESVADINGHGTHVASTIVGTGAASNGENKGVAPGADLIVGKVLGGTDGYGDDSWVLAGMEWAAKSGADVISMSLGSGPTDGTDPMSMAVDALSAQYGSLFVIAAGNSGPETLSSPATAASALSVGATDKQDNLAYFSSTGPVFGSGAIKPDLSAPGVDINAAWSSQAPTPSLYNSISGTSMATPHVSGAAAILMQQHPDWTGQRIKDALMSSAKGLAEWYTPYEVGTGRLDVTAAIRSTITATGSVFLGNFDWPHEPGDAPVSKPVTFTNSGTADVTLNLTLNATGPLTLGASTVTVPAGGTASVNVTGDPTGPDHGRFTGYLVATDAATGQAVTRTSVALIKENERYNLTIKLKDRQGNPAKGQVVMDIAGDFWSYVLPVDGEGTFRLPPGLLTLSTAMDVTGERPDSLGMAVLVDPETVFNKNTEVVLDASKARLLDTRAPQSTEDRQRKIDFQIDYDGNLGRVRAAYQVPVKYDDLYLSPTESMTKGEFAASTRWRKGEKTLSVKAFGLLPFDVTVQPGSTVTTGTDLLAAVYAGDGAASDYKGLDAKGKTVVVTRSDAVSPTDRTANAVAAGAKLLLVVNDGAGILNEWVGESPIPVATVHRDAGALLVFMAKTGKLKLTAAQVPYATYLYDLTRNYPGQVPNKALSYHPSRADLARINSHFYAVSDREGAGYRWDMTFSPSFGFRERESHPGIRTEYVTPIQVWHESHEQGEWTDTVFHDSYGKGTVTRTNWFAPAIRPAFTRAFAVQNGRYRDFMTLNVQAFSSSGNDGMEHGGNMGWGSVPNTIKLYQGDTLIDENQWNSDLQWAEVPTGKLPFRAVVDSERPAEWRLSTRTHTEWDFFSESNDADNFVPMTLLQLNYALATDLRGDVKSGQTHDISIWAGPQPGGSGTGNITSVTLDVSYDDGATWQKVTLLKGANGNWKGKLKLTGAPGGFLSVKASATTDSGYAIRQEIIRAYGLS
ncbi:S8 family peptidase [Catelliglobosispora koreensis]|uniref:S8 family peptidase n=1 Tax=Catelliglobosispora koreensis TaxID=129052 RepID=UPI00058D7728|nr:S8 family serine peptidase [Catelliglobosispora koreensis]